MEFQGQELPSACRRLIQYLEANGGTVALDDIPSRLQIEDAITLCIAQGLIKEPGPAVIRHTSPSGHEHRLELPRARNLDLMPVAKALVAHERLAKGKAKRGIPERSRRAAESLEWVMSERHDLTPEPPWKYCREQWEYIRDYPCPAYTDQEGEAIEVPGWETWKRYVRAGLAGSD